MSEELKYLYDRGSELYEKGEYKEAEPLLKALILKNPFYADVLNKLGVIAKMKDNLERAAEFFRRALALNPSYTEAALNLSVTLNDMGQSDEAQAVLASVSKASKEAPGKLDPFLAGKLANEHFKLGNIYYDFHMLDEAVEQYKRAVSLRPGLADIHTRLGRALRDNGHKEEAIEHFETAKSTNPNYCPALVQLGLSHYMDGRLDLAVREWQAALKINPELKDAKAFLDLAEKEA